MNSQLSAIVFFCTILSIGLRAQSLSVSFPDTVRWGAAIDSSAISFWTNDIVTNTTANSVTVDVVRVQDATGTPGWYSEFCFQYCSQSWVDSIRTTMLPYEVVNIAVHIIVSSTPDTGSVLMKYVNVNDSTEVYYQRFYASTSPVSIAENYSQSNGVACYPQPANSGDVITFNLSDSQFSGQSCMLTISNAYGQKIKSIDNVGAGANPVLLDLPPGIYTWTLTTADDVVDSGKLILTP
jgi:hypothetical protein